MLKRALVLFFVVHISGLVIHISGLVISGSVMHISKRLVDAHLMKAPIH